jgi:hypothetical protein
METVDKVSEAELMMTPVKRIERAIIHLPIHQEKLVYLIQPISTPYDQYQPTPT